MDRHDHLGAWRDGLFDQLGIDLISVFATIDEDRFCSSS
jgi:hypothetical protein